jgi:hypothetical protein
MLGPKNIPDGISWVYHNYSGLLWIHTFPLHNNRASPILLSIVNKLSDSRILTSHRKPSSCLWAGYNMAKTTHSKTVLGPENIPDVMSRVYHNDAGLLWIHTFPLHDDRASPILLSIVNKLKDSRILTSHHKPSSCLWAGYNMAKTTHSKTVLGPENTPDVMSWVNHNDAGLLWIHTFSLRDDRTSPILSSIVNKLSDSRILASHCNTSICLWAGYGMAKRFQSQSLLFLIVHIIIRFLETHSRSWIRPLPVSQTQYD